MSRGFTWKQGLIWLALGFGGWGLIIGGVTFAAYHITRAAHAQNAPASAVPTTPLSSSVYPDLTLTPGATDPDVSQATILKTICVVGYTSTVRNVSEKTKHDVVLKYVTTHPDWPLCKPAGGALCEIDHLISLELGGLNDASNLWPEPYCLLPHQPDCLGAREKDVVETWLRKQVCLGNITLVDAQNRIVHDWVKQYRAIMADR